MKAEYCQTQDCHQSIKKQLLDAIDLKIIAIFEGTASSRYAKMQDLHNYLHKRKAIGGLQNAFRQKFFKILLEEELKQFNFIKTLDHYTLKVLRLTKCKLKDFKVDWRQIIAKLQSTDKTTNKLSRLYSFLRLVRDYYDENNAMDVFNHFLGNYKFSDEITWIYMEQFVNLTKNTKPQIANELLARLKEFHTFDSVKDICYYRWLVRMKRKLPQLVMGEYLEDLNHQILNELILTHNKEKSLLTSISAKFLTEIFAKFIGKTNPKSVEMVNWFFKIYESGISAFQDKKTGIRMVRNFLAPLWKRKSKQDTLRKKLEKKDQEQQDDEKEKDQDKDQSKDEKDKEKQDKAEMIQNAIGAMVLMNESEDEDQEDEIDQSMPTQEKEQLRAEKLAQLQADELTPQIMNALKSNIELILEDLFFTPNKQVSNVLKYVYFLFPELAAKSIQYVSKGMSIDEHNFGIHMKNTKKIVQYLFVFGQRERLMEDILTILSEVAKIRYVKDAWNLLCYISMKIPCMDEEDYKLVPQQIKKDFERNFKIQHDVFYEKYSETMFELFKRFIKETEVKERKVLLKQDNPYLGFAYNVYPEFDKRCLELVISNYIENPNPFIYNYLELKHIPEKHIQSFLPELKSTETQQQAFTKYQQLLIASKSVSFERFIKIIKDLAQHESYEHRRYLLNTIKCYCQQNILLNPVMKPIESSLSYLWNPEARYSVELKNTNPQSVDDALKKLVSVWREHYEELHKFVQDHAKTLESKIDPVQIVRKFYFSTGKPDFELRKQLLWRLETIQAIIEYLPSPQLVWSQQPILKELKFKQFPSIKEIHEKTPKLVQDLLKIFLVEFPHEYKIMARLQTLTVVSSTVADNFEQYILEFKDVVKVIKNNESVNHTNLYFSLLKQSNKYLVYDQAYRYLHNDTDQNKRLAELVQLAFLHPDEEGVGQLTRQEDYDITTVLLALLSMPPPEGTEDNKIKLFHEKLSSELTALFEKPRTKIAPETLFRTMALVISFITSSQKVIREGYLETLKNLLVIVQDVKIDEKSLEVITQGLSHASSKQKLVWAIGLIFLEDSSISFGRFYEMLNELLFSDDFLLRKYSQFLLSYIIRVDRKKHTKTTVLDNLGQYKQKTLDEFLQTGYLRPEHIDLNMKKKKVLMKYRSYNKCTIKQKQSNKESVSFVFDAGKALSFVKQYQTDQVSSEDELLLKKKASFSELSELADIFTWLKSRYSKVVDISEHRFTSYESIFGQRFFKYIFEADYQNGFPFFKATREFIETVCLPNLQTLDNQVVVINYMSMLLKAYSKFHKTIPSQQVEAFILKAMTEIIEKSSGQFFNHFRRLSLLHVDELPLLVNFFKKYSPTHPNFYRTVQIRLVWFSHKRQELIQMLKDIFKSGKNLQNSNVSKLIKQIIQFNQKHFFNDRQVNECKVISLKQLQEKKDIVKETEHVYTASRKQFDDILVQNLKSLIGSELLEDRKTGNDLLNQSIKTYLLLHKTKANLDALNVLLNMAIQIIITNKEQYKTDEDLFQNTLTFMLCQVFPQNEFPVLLETLKKLLVPIPKVSNYLKVFYKNPYNIIRLSEQNYQDFLKRLLTLLQSNLRFKELLTTLGGLLYFRKPQVEDISKLGSNSREVMTLYMALLLSDVRHLDKYEKQLQKIINSKEKDKMKAWATIMINSRGKRQILESEETHRLWKSIKDVSNPYFYHC